MRTQSASHSLPLFLSFSLSLSLSLSLAGTRLTVGLTGLNIPHYLLDDVQTNAVSLLLLHKLVWQVFLLSSCIDSPCQEYVAYAINYISAVSGNRSVSVIAWSQGNIDSQWALKYWPSTRSVTSNLISISADFHGTLAAAFICPGVLSAICNPSVIQQGYTSNLIMKLRSNNGDSAYVPTTSIYSLTDEIVIPQTGTGASAFMGDARGVGVSNTMVQDACFGQLAGGVYTHEGVLYNPLAFALAVDALTNPGPGQLSRIDLASVCAQISTSGLTVGDLVATEG
jgi:hypothetical protein